MFHATRITFLSLGLLLVVMACSTGGGSSASNGSQAGTDVGVPVDGGGSYVDITPTRLADMLKAKDFSLVNVHIPYDGEIEPTDAFIPYDQIEAHLGELPSRDSKIVLYCRSGSMSAIAARALVAAGYTNVANLDGGMNAWRAQGYDIAQKPAS